jgi:hypothetical protein
VFLMLVFEPVRRSVSKAFMHLHSGFTPAVVDVNWSNRAEARMIAHVERERLFDVTREAAHRERGEGTPGRSLPASS